MFIIQKTNKKGHILNYVRNINTGKLKRITHWDIREEIRLGLPVIIQEL